MAVWYLFIFAGLQMVSFTNAAFNDIENQTAEIHVKWPVEEWDKSSLDFDNMKSGGSCSPPVIYAEIKNTGEDMTFSVWSWELYQVEKGQKKILGSVLDSGEVPMIEHGKIGRITANPIQGSLTDGFYRIKVTKPDRPGKDEIWSEPIEIKCGKKKQQSNVVETEKVQETEQEVATPEKDETIGSEAETDKPDSDDTNTPEDKPENTEVSDQNVNTEPEKEKTTEHAPAESQNVDKTSETDSEEGEENND